MSHKHRHHQDGGDERPAEPGASPAPEPPTERAAGEVAPEAGENGGPPKIEQELEDLKQSLLRVAADYQNYQKRARREIEQASQVAEERLAKGLIPVLDDFDRALSQGRDVTGAEAVLEGVRLVHEGLLRVLASRGLKPIEVQPGTPFDPALHEAMMYEEHADLPENSICRELARGYVMNGRVLRAAKVTVAKKPAAADGEQTESRTDNGEE
jgi:molecular chaperone GrpE